MPYERFIRALLEKKHRCLLIVCALLILCLSQSTLAQSGRRQSKNPSPTPPVTVEPKTENEAKPPAVKPAPVATIIVSGDRLGSSLYIPSGYVDVAIRSCVDRLEESASLAVTVGGNMTRKESIDRAKKEKDSHVLWLEVKMEEYGTNEVSIGYAVFAPQTGKSMTSGRVYLGSKGLGSGGVRVGVPSTSRRMSLEYQMREAGRDVAERVMSKFQANTSGLLYKYQLGDF
jgi:hypothetical protein